MPVLSAWPTRGAPRPDGLRNPVDGETRPCARVRDPTRALFHRKHYWYPDLPKGTDLPVRRAPLLGWAFHRSWAGRRSRGRIVRAHLEEDAARAEHRGGAGDALGLHRVVGHYNRGGTPRSNRLRAGHPLARGGGRYLQLLRQTVVSSGSGRRDGEGIAPLRRERLCPGGGETGFRTKTELKTSTLLSLSPTGSRPRWHGKPGFTSPARK